MTKPKTTNPFVSDDFVDQLVELSKMDLPVSSSRGSKIIQQTLRNNIRKSLLDSLVYFFDSYLDNPENQPETKISSYRTADGVVIEIENESIARKAKTEGMVSMIIDLSFPNLDYDAYSEALDYEEREGA